MGWLIAVLVGLVLGAAAFLLRLRFFSPTPPPTGLALERDTGDTPPDSSEYNRWRALVEVADTAQRDGHWSIAEDLYRKALGILPTSPEILNSLALVVGVQGAQREPEAREFLEKALELDPSYSKARHSLAMLDEGHHLCQSPNRFKKHTSQG
jgi:Tfp pilus assembly protein PilF